MDSIERYCLENIFFDVGIASSKILSEISRFHPERERERKIYFREIDNKKFFRDLKRDLSRDIVSNEFFTSDIISNNIFQCIVSSRMSIKISLEMKSYPVSRKIEGGLSMSSRGRSLS